MNAEQTEIFISYRREDGREFARTLYLAFGKLGYQNIFFDYNSMRGGTFNTQIDVAIKHCKDFILVLSPRSMDRCGIEDDWVAHEIREAIQYGCNIIPIAIEQNYVSWPSDLPRDLNIIKMIQQRILATNEFFDASVQLIAEILTSKPETKSSDPSICELTISSDETSLLFVDGQSHGKIKGGKQRVLSLPTDASYHIKLESLAKKGDELMQEVNIEKKEFSRTIEFSFLALREGQKSRAAEERQKAKQMKEEQRNKEGFLMQACENYEKNGDLSSGMVIVSLKGRIGYLNEKGFEAIACEYDDGTDFHGDYTTVCKNGKWGIIDRLGQVVVPLLSDTPCWSEDDYRFFVVSRNQHYAISSIAQGIPSAYPYEDVSILYGFKTLFAVKKESLWSIIDATGAQSPITFQARQIDGYSGYYQSFCNKKWNLVRWLVPPLGLQHPSTNRWGYFNRQLLQTIPFVDDGADRLPTYRPTNNIIIKTSGHMGLVDVETGALILPAIYDYVEFLYCGDTIEFYLIADGCKCNGYEIDQEGNKKEETYLFWGGKQGVANVNGEIIVPQHYHLIRSIAIESINDGAPYFLCYLFKDLQFSWEDWGRGKKFSLRCQFDKEQSFIHIYASDGKLIRQIPCNAEGKVKDIICEAWLLS